MSSTSKKKDMIKSVLIVDDEKDSLDVYSELLSKSLKAEIVSCQFPTQALIQANQKLYDIILIDVTIDYLGNSFGGLDLYKQLLPRYGKHSLIAYSQYITDDLLKRYNYDFNFFEKHNNVVKFVSTICKKMESLRKNQSCFIAMPFSEKYDDIFKVLENCSQKSFYKCIRVDSQTFTKSIIDKIFEEISDSKIVIFVSNDKNPNAFYECGYSVALDKEVITITDHYSSLPFDIRDRNAIAYGNDFGKLEQEVMLKLSNLTIVD